MRALAYMIVAAMFTACDSQPTAPPGGTPDANVADPPDADVTPSPPDTSTYVPTQPTFTCVPGAAPNVSPLRRLTRLQYTHTLNDLVRWALGPEASTNAILEELTIPLAQIPADDTRLEGTNHDIAQALVEGHYDSAAAVADALTRDAATITRLVGPCATDDDPANDLACITAFIDRFGARALRRPLDADELAFFLTEAFDAPTITRTPLRDLIHTMLMAPSVVFHLELGTPPATGAAGPNANPDVYPLSSHELASRLSYLFWQGPPDDTLIAAAADGTLMTEAGYRTQVERIFNDPRTATTLDSFIWQWLDFDRLPQPADEVGTEPFDTFAGDDSPSPNLARRMAQEVLDLARYHTWTVDGTLDDLFLTDHSFATTPDLASIYDVAVWDGQSTPPRFTPGERSGLLTRAALLVSGTWHTLPIHKGVVIRRRILCDTMGTPPEGAQGATVDLPAPYTQRQYAEELTMRDGTSCIGCHSWMNPIGFATEGYDALGRTREYELTFDEATATSDWLPVDTNTVPRADRGDPRPAKDAIEASQLLVESGKPHACVARYYVRFALGRMEDSSLDGCLLEQLRAALAAGQPLRDVFMSLALTPEFKLVRVGAQTAPDEEVSP